jgi:hypothetical protein
MSKKKAYIVQESFKRKYSALLLGAGIALFSSHSFGEPLTKAVVVMRHAQEPDDGVIIPHDMQTHKLPTSPEEERTYNRGHLSTLGQDCSEAIDALLPGFMDKNGFAPISRVVTKDPDNSTPNPLASAWPFIKVNYESISVRLDGNDISKVLNDIDAEDGGSTLIVYDRENLWGPTQNETAEEGSIIQILNNAYGVHNSQVKMYPDKCKALYIYTGKNIPENKLQTYKLNEAFTEIKEVSQEVRWPQEG